MSGNGRLRFQCPLLPSSDIALRLMQRPRWARSAPQCRAPRPQRRQRLADFDIRLGGDIRAALRSAPVSVGLKLARYLASRSAEVSGSWPCAIYRVAPDQGSPPGRYFRSVRASIPIARTSPSPSLNHEPACTRRHRAVAGDACSSAAKLRRGGRRDHGWRVVRLPRQFVLTRTSSR